MFITNNTCDSYCKLYINICFYRNEEIDINNSLSYSLAEASKLTYVCGKWVDTCDEWSRHTEIVYEIVAPTLPSNGDYSAYNEWGLYLK